MAITDIIKTQSGKDILKMARPKEQRQVFGHFLYEGELGILFGDSNTGKSILANDIAFFASGGGHEWQDMVSPNIPSMYIDMEMSVEQFARRYEGAGDYIPEAYNRAEVEVLSSKEDKIFSAIKANIIIRQGDTLAPKLIIIDNITNGFGSIFSATKMRTLISDLKALKNKFGLTILLIAHCPKRKPNTPITDNSMGGSKMLINFCDSAFAIAPSVQDESMKYIKQIKTREEKKLSDVMAVKIVNEPYLCMKFAGWSEEFCHIDECFAGTGFELSAEAEIQLVKLLTEGEKNYSEIADIIGCTRNYVIDYAIDNNL